LSKLSDRSAAVETLTTIARIDHQTQVEATTAERIAW